MFLDFYKLREQPFGVSPDPRFLYLGESHREALASIFYGVESDQGFLALISPPGLGKTTLTFHLFERLRQTARTVFLFQTQCNSREMFQYLLSALGVDPTGMEMVAMHNRLNQILSQEMLAGRRFVLAIDEAQNLDPSVLETIRLLSNYETPNAKLLQILLIGQPELAHKLASPELVQLQQRISVFARIEPFTLEDTARYIAHRLQVAGYTGGTLFAPSAVEIIAQRSQGIPREINRLCFSALSLGCAMGRSRIDSEIMREVIADLNVDSLNRPPAKREVAPDKVEKNLPLSYRTRVRIRPGRLALQALSVIVVFAAVGLSILASTSGRIGRLWQGKAEGSQSFPSASPLLEKSTETSTETGPSPLIGEKSAESPAVERAQSTPTNRASSTTELVTVAVQPGDTLYRIALRTMGQANDSLLEQIQDLNPSVTNPDHIEVGQEIRLPQSSQPVVPLSGFSASDKAESTQKE